MSFKECAACAAKPGAPVLCESCLHNRALIEKLEKQRDHWRRENADANETVEILRREQQSEASTMNAIRDLAMAIERLAEP